MRTFHSGADTGPVFPQLYAWQRYYLALALGILAWSVWPAPVSVLAVLIGFLFFFLHSYHARLSRVRLLILVLFFVLGGGLGAWSSPAPAPENPPWLTGRDMLVVRGRVASVEGRPGQRLTIILEEVECQAQGRPFDYLPGKLAWVWQEAQFRPVPGERVELELRVKPVHGFANHGTWSYEAFWAERGVYFRAYARGQHPVERSGKGRIADRVRSELLERTQALLFSPEHGAYGQGKALVLALLFGDRFYLAPETVELLRHTSLAHTLALSGLHVGYVVFLGGMLAWGLGRLFPSIYLRLPLPKLGVLFASLLALTYVWLGGATPSLLRASAMYLAWGVLLWRGRGRVLLDGLFVALVVLTLYNPRMVLDVRLQLSAVAVAGIATYLQLRRQLFAEKLVEKSEASTHAQILLPQWLRARLCFVYEWMDSIKCRALYQRGELCVRLLRRGVRRVLRGAMDILFVSISAQLVLLPLLVNTFGELSPHIYLNVFWLPLLGLVILPLSVFGLACVPLLPEFAQPVLMAAAYFLDWGLGCFGDMAAWGWLEIFVPLRPAWPAGVGYWILLGCFVVWLARRSESRIIGKGYATCVLLGVVCLLLPSFLDVFNPAHSGVTLRVLDVGQGQSLVLETPRGRRLLLDGGGFASGFDVGKGVIAPVLTSNSPPVLERVVYSHGDMDHVGGLMYPLRNFRVGGVAGNGRPILPALMPEMTSILEKKHFFMQSWSIGRVIDLGHGVELEVLYPHARGVELLSKKKKGRNSDSLVLRLVWHGKGLALFPGDVLRKGQMELLALNKDVRSEVLVLPHHGAKSSFLPEMYNRVAPKIALCSAGFLNRWNFPNKAVRAGLAQRNVPLYVTGECGEIAVHWSSFKAAPVVTTYRECVPGK